MPSDNEQVIVESKYIRLLRRGTWEYAERPNIGGIVGIVAVTPEGKLLLVEQFRIPVNARVVELPAGLAGDSPEFQGEDLTEAARRELLEETGYEARRMTFLVDGPPSAGMTTEVLSLYLAEDLVKTGAGGGDHTEDLIIHEIPLADVPAWLADKRRQGIFLDLRIYTALFFLQHMGCRVSNDA